MDTLKEIKPNTLAITLRVSELEALITRSVTQALASMPFWQDDPNKQQLLALLPELSIEQARQVLAFAVELLANAPPQEGNNPDSTAILTIVDAREADNEAQATIAHALSNLITGNVNTSEQ
jgi:hypothetical protein